jgi:hypothetical protein
METKRILLAAMLGLVLAGPAMAQDHHPGDANPPAAGLVAQVQDPQATDAQAAPNPRYPAPPPTISVPVQNSTSDQLGYVIDGDKAYKRNYGN